MHYSECLCFKLTVMSKKLARIYRQKLQGFNLTNSQFYILSALYEKDGVSIGTLGKKVRLDNATLTGIIDRLERDGYIKRTASVDDRREINIYLTPKGAGIKGKIKKVHIESEKQILGIVAQAEVNAINSAYVKINNAC